MTGIPAPTENRAGGPRVLCVCGPSGAGKTTLVRGLLPRLSPGPERIGILKHTHHALEWHPEGTDSGRLWEAGPAAVCVTGPDQHACFTRRPTGARAPDGDGRREGADRGKEGSPSADAPTAELLSALDLLPPGLALVLAEGFHRALAPKLWVAADSPRPDRRLPEGVFAVAVAEDVRAAWKRAAGDVPVYGRNALGGLASAVEAAAASAREIRREFA